MRLSNRQYWLLGLLICALLGFVLNYYVYEPLANRKSQLQNEHELLAQRMTDIEDKLHFIRETQDQGQDIRADYVKMRSRVPPQPMIPEIISFLELTATETNLNVISVNYKEQEYNTTDDGDSADTGETDRIGTVNMEFSATGNRFEIMSFVLAIENSPRLFIIDDLIMSTDTCENSNGHIGSNANISATPEQMTLKLKIKAYYSI